ncbi:MAG TPA: cytochrome c oxidase assembly protein [Aestuariivirga sp.]
MQDPDERKIQYDRNTRVALMAAGLFFGMIGMAYASVPLYRIFCQRTGFNGTALRATRAPEHASDKFINVRFDSNSASELGWTFVPKQNVMRVQIGEQNIAYFEGRNNSDREEVASAVYNISPPSAGAFFNKIQCFCFTRQTLKAGESAEFPVTFFVDPDILKDADGKLIPEITLSYTFYPAAAATPQKQALAN